MASKGYKRGTTTKKKTYVPDVAKTAQHPQSQLKSQKELKTITGSTAYKEGSDKKKQSLLSWGLKDPRNIKTKKKTNKKNYSNK